MISSYQEQKNIQYRKLVMREWDLWEKEEMNLAAKQASMGEAELRSLMNDLCARVDMRIAKFGIIMTAEEKSHYHGVVMGDLFNAKKQQYKGWSRNG